MTKPKTPTLEELKIITSDSLLDYYKEFIEFNLATDQEKATEEEWQHCFKAFIDIIKPAIISEDRSLPTAPKAIALIKNLTDAIEALSDENKYGNSVALYTALMLAINPTLEEVSASKIACPKPARTTSPQGQHEAPKCPTNLKPSASSPFTKLGQTTKPSTTLQGSASSAFKTFYINKTTTGPTI